MHYYVYKEHVMYVFICSYKAFLEGRIDLLRGVTQECGGI